MNSDRSILSRQLTLLTILTMVGSTFRLLPYWKEEYNGWLFCIWGANAILPLFMVGVSKCKPIWWGYLIPFLGFIVSDLIIEWILKSRNLPGSSFQARLMMYAIFLVLSQLGLILRYVKLPRWNNVIAGVGLTLLGSISFFLFTNFLIWLRSTPADGQYYYEPTFSGLVRCYELALPFFRNQFFGDAVFSILFLGIYAFAEQWNGFFAKKPAAVTS